MSWRRAKERIREREKQFLAAPVVDSHDAEDLASRIADYLYFLGMEAENGEVLN